MSLLTEEQLRQFMVWRHVKAPCQKCYGRGVLMYSSGATWRGGAGTCSFEVDTCDACWGTGDAERQGVDLRKLEAKQRDWEDEQCLAYFARKTGASLTSTKQYMLTIARIFEREERRRKTPFDDESNGFYWRQMLHIVAAAFRKFGGSK